MKTFNNSQSGFTLIEMIVSVAIFTTVVGIAVGSLLVLVGANLQLQKEQSVMTNLSFALDSMTRELRTGSHYNCVTAAASAVGNIFHSSSDLDSIVGKDTQDCEKGRVGVASNKLHGVSFIEGGGSITGSGGRILYFHDMEKKKIYRKVGSSEPQEIVSSGIVITDAEFVVTGSKPQSDGSIDSDDQAKVTIFIEARDIDDLNAKPYMIQTTVTQRALDI